MNSFEKFTNWIKPVWNFELFNLGDTAFTTRTFILLIASLFLLIYVTSIIRKLLVSKIFPRYDMNVGVSQSIATIIRYILVIIGLFIIFQTSGIDLSAIGILVGALGIGIGFGLQNITNN